MRFKATADGVGCRCFEVPARRSLLENLSHVQELRYDYRYDFGDWTSHLSLELDHTMSLYFSWTLSLFVYTDKTKHDLVIQVRGMSMFIQVPILPIIASMVLRSVVLKCREFLKSIVQFYTKVRLFPSLYDAMTSNRQYNQSSCSEETLPRWCRYVYPIDYRDVPTLSPFEWSRMISSCLWHHACGKSSIRA